MKMLHICYLSLLLLLVRLLLKKELKLQERRKPYGRL
jgi:hypothetical protein